MFSGSKILITGGTGSFGHSVLSRFLKTDVAEIRIFSRDEKKQDDMRHELNCDRVKFYIGDVRDRQSVDFAMRGVDYVFHAAALKQVPSCEFYPIEAVKTNILGTENVIESAMSHRVKRVVALGTDKAVHPVNAMGMTKALMEKVVQAKARTGTDVSTILGSTRYGNVMASRGSVIPLFIDQIKSGKPLTVTDPEMTRFMMSLDEAVELVLFAFEHARQGDLFVQKAPAATVGDVAEGLKKIFNVSNEIRVIGTRHGEKKHETLLSREERARSQDMDNYYRVLADGRDLNYELYFSQGQESVSNLDDYTSENTRRLNLDEVISVMMSLDYVKRELENWKR